MILVLVPINLFGLAPIAFAKFINISSDTTDIILRHDTRIYFVSGEYHVDDGNCIGAVICKNIGSAKYKTLDEWAPLNLDKDRT